MKKKKKKISHRICDPIKNGCPLNLDIFGGTTNHPNGVFLVGTWNMIG